MLVRKWFDHVYQLIRGNLRFRLFLLICLSILPGTVLIILSIITKQHLEALAVFVIAISLVIAVWFGGDLLIFNSLKSLIKLSKRLSSGELGARSSQTDSIGLFGELAQSFNRIAASLEIETEKLRKQIVEHEAISEIASEATVQHDIAALLQLIVDKVATLLNTPYAVISLYDASHSDLEIVAVNGLKTPPKTKIRMGEGAAGRAAETRQPLIVDRYDQWESRLREFGSYHVTAVVQVPMVYRDELIGVLGVAEIGLPRKFNPSEMRLMKTIAGMAASAIRNARLLEQTQKQLKRLNALHQIDLAIANSPEIDNIFQELFDQVITHMGGDAASVLVANPHQRTLDFAASRGFKTGALRNTHLRFGEGYAGRAALDQRTIYIQDLNTRHTDYLRSPSFSAEGFVSYFAIPLMAKGQVLGVLEVFHRSLFKPDPEWLNFLEALAGQAAIVIGYAKLLEDLQRSNNELNLAYDSTLEGWSQALDVRDRETGGHSQRVAEMTLRLARAMAIPEQDLVHIHRGALLHDIGKLGISDSILLKSGPLDDKERDMIRKHPSIAFEMLAPIVYLRPALDIPYCHHEKWDGTGYPRGLKREEIPLSARIFAVVDVWDALTSDRPYRKAWSEAKALAYVQEQSGKHFDPQVVKAFLSLKDDERANGGNNGRPLKRISPGELFEQTLHDHK